MSIKNSSDIVGYIDIVRYVGGITIYRTTGLIRIDIFIKLMIRHL